jgi:hypothetical protein
MLGEERDQHDREEIENGEVDGACQQAHKVFSWELRLLLRAPEEVGSQAHYNEPKGDAGPKNVRTISREKPDWYSGKG